MDFFGIVVYKCMFYKNMDAVCMLCSVLSCAAGFRSSGCSFGSVSDAVCVPCGGGPLTGPYNWTSGCEFQCSDGFWFNGTDCAVCDVLECAPGFYSSDCSGTNNSECAACVEPSIIGPIRWTCECNFTCAEGFYGPQCVPCSDPLCMPGSVLRECTVDQDASCSLCAAPYGLFAWVGGCEFECLHGWYHNGNGCMPCTQRSCVPGSYFTACNATADSSCSPCAAVSPGSVWTQGCEYECLAGQYYFNGSGCSPCSTPMCEAGTVLSACSADFDAGCVGCDQLFDGSFAWTSGCEYECLPGFFRGDRCLPCSVLECGPGTIPVNCTNVSDATCAACEPPAGAFQWVQPPCQYECDAGSFRGASGCLQCNPNLICTAGFRPSACGYAEDAKCEPCANALDEGSYFTDGCAFACLDGYYFNSSGLCAPCTTDPCRAGTYRVECTAYSDALCVDCATPVGGFVWTDGCSFDCLDGYYRDGAFACTRCSVPDCVPGTIPTNCTLTSDASCQRCASVSGSAWTSGCDFQCIDGFYRNGAGCARCSVQSCEPGMYPVPCSPAADSRCSQCVPSTEGSVWTTNCNFQCIEGYYRLNSSFCSPCSEKVCGPGSFFEACTVSRDSKCSPCTNDKGIGTVWTDGCAFGCADGFALESGRCVMLPPQTTAVAVPRVFAVVQSALTIQNTVSEVCVNLAALLRSMSDALSLLSNGTAHFQTNVTALEGLACVNNVCPQCAGNSSVNFTETVASFDEYYYSTTDEPFTQQSTTDEPFTPQPALFFAEPALFFAEPEMSQGLQDEYTIEPITTSSSRRRLLSSSVSIVVVSQSNASIPASSSPPVFSSVQLLSVLSTPGLSVGSIVAVVSTVTAGGNTVVVVVVEEDDSAFLYFLARIIGVLVLVVLLFVCFAVCRWTCCKSYFFNSSRMHAQMHRIHNDPIVRMAGRLVVPQRKKYKL